LLVIGLSLQKSKQKMIHFKASIKFNYMLFFRQQRQTSPKGIEDGGIVILEISDVPTKNHQ